MRSCCSSGCCLQKRRQAPLLRRFKVHLHNEPSSAPGRQKQPLRSGFVCAAMPVLLQALVKDHSAHQLLCISQSALLSPDKSCCFAL